MTPFKLESESLEVHRKGCYVNKNECSAGAVISIYKAGWVCLVLEGCWWSTALADALFKGLNSGQCMEAVR